MSEIDWSKAPEGSTHRVPNGCWYKIKEDQVYCWSSRYQWDGPYPIKQYEDGSLDEMVRRPKCSNEWTGAGLPPVGVDCETLWSSTTGQYVTVKILAHDEDRAVVRFTSGERKGEYASDRQHNQYSYPIFRPIRSPDLIEVDERDIAIKDLMRLDGIYHAEAASIYDAGYRKTDVK